MRKPRIALCHEWATTYGGSEQVASDIAAALGIEDVFVFTAEEVMSQRLFPASQVHVTRLGRTRLARRHWQEFLPLMPFAWRRFDFSGFDVVITNSHACTNSIRTRPETVRVSMCHTPMRYAWLWRMEIDRFPAWVRPVWPVAAWALRKADWAWSRKVDAWYGNSTYSAARVSSIYEVDAGVVFPPVDVEFWSPDGETRDDYFLFAGRLVAYKEPLLAVRAANKTGLPLIVAGDGPELPRLRAEAGPTVEFVISPTREQLRDLYRRARALLYPGVEEFGITMIEAAACGTPGLGFDDGGLRDTVVDAVTGSRYQSPDLEALCAAMLEFDEGCYERDEIVAHAKKFSTQEFHRRIREVVADAIESYSPSASKSDWATYIRSMG